MEKNKEDRCFPDKTNKMIKVFPDIEFITAHMGGMKYLHAWSGCTWVDISFDEKKKIAFENINKIVVI